MNGNDIINKLKENKNLFKKREIINAKQNF